MHAGDDGVRKMNHTYVATPDGPERCTEVDALLAAIDTRSANAHSYAPGAQAWTDDVQH